LCLNKVVRNLDQELLERMVKEVIASEIKRLKEYKKGIEDRIKFSLRDDTNQHIFDNILKNGLKTQQDDYLIIYSKKLSMKSISLVNKRIIARCYADNHNFKNPKTFRFGDSIFWIVRHYTKMYILAYTILAPRSLMNILNWREKNKINSKKSWSRKRWTCY